MIPCPECGRPANAEAQTCASCGHALANGTPAKINGQTAPPPELRGYTFHKTPPEMVEEMRQTFNEEEFLAELRETEKAGGCELKDFLQNSNAKRAARE